MTTKILLMTFGSACFIMAGLCAVIGIDTVVKSKIEKKQLEKKQLIGAAISFGVLTAIAITLFCFAGSMTHRLSP